LPSSSFKLRQRRFSASPTDPRSSCRIFVVAEIITLDHAPIGLKSDDKYEIYLTCPLLIRAFSRADRALTTSRNNGIDFTAY